MTATNLHHLPDPIRGKSASISQALRFDNLRRLANVLLSIKTLKLDYSCGAE